jgi:hypothetical protein
VPSSYRANAIPTCECGSRLTDAPLLSPATGAPVCGACHAKELRDGPELAGAQSRPGEALRHLAMSLAQPKGDAMLARRGVCRACGGTTVVESVRQHIEEFQMLLGTSYGHVCEKCRKTFRTETLWATFARSVYAAVTLAIAWLCWFISGTTNNVLAALFATLGVALIGQRVVRIRNRWFAAKKRA